MVVKVVDASALGAFLFGEADAAAAAARFTKSNLVAPALLQFEIASIACKKARREPEQSSAIARALAVYSAMDIKSIDVDIAAVVDLANATRLSAYDASYLWLARNLSAELVTLDRRLDAAAKQIRFV